MVVTNQSIPVTNSGNKWVSPGALLRPTALTWGISRGLEKWKTQLLAGFANTVAEQTRISSYQEKAITQEMRVWKREREKFILGASSWERWQAQA